jgi:hypothetical protein
MNSGVYEIRNIVNDKKYIKGRESKNNTIGCIGKR